MVAAADCDVLIVGAGPTGATLALLLAQDGLSVMVADRAADIYPLPRAAHIDHEAMRIFQSLGLADAIAATCRRVARYDFLNRERQVLLRFDGSDAIGPGGWPVANMIHQPSIEQALHGALRSTPRVSLHRGWELTAVAERDGGIDARFATPSGAREISARFLVGADGARSRVRELAGLGLEDLGFDEPWLVIDTLVRDAARLPEVNLQICDPERPTTSVLMGSGRHRWEFMLKPGETPEEVAEDGFIARLLEPWQVEGAIEIERKAVYRFSARLAGRWRQGRLMVAGDAAHQMPPFAGQGLCSGLRDAANLSWKLAAAVRDEAAGDRLLDTYQPEREPHVRAIIGLATMMGRTVCLLDETAAAARDAQMIAARASGAAPVRADWPALSTGCLLAGSAKAGTYFPQVVAERERVPRLDDVLGHGAWLIGRTAVPDSDFVLRSVALDDPALAPFRTGIGGWLNEAGGEAVLVRPDRTVFGTGRPDALASAFRSWVSTRHQGGLRMAQDGQSGAAAPHAALDGIYAAVVTSPLGDEALTLTITVEGDAFRGTSRSEKGSNDIAGSVQDATLTWQEQVTTPFPMTLDVVMTVSGDEVSGTVKAGAFGVFPMTGRRAGAAAPSAAPVSPAAGGATAHTENPAPGTRSGVFRVAYVELNTPSLDQARAYYEGVLGLRANEVSAGAAYLALGVDHHTIALRQAGREGLGAIGLQVAPHISLSDLSGKLRDLGFSPELKSDVRPGVPALLDIADVGGHRFHLISAMSVEATGHESAGIAPLKLGHVALLSPQPGALLSFLRQGLGFFTTDWFDDLVTFVTCNHDHHVLNVAAAPVATLHHLAFQLGGADHQVRAADWLARRGSPTLWGPARHTAGHNVASYHHGADKALIELYNDLDVFSPELGYCEPRPWHGDRPQTPKRWKLTDMTRWNTRYEFAFSAIEFGIGT